MFERMEIAEQVYEGWTPSKTATRAEADRAIHGRKRKGVESVSPTNPENCCTDKRKKNNAGHINNCPTGDKTCLVPGPGHTTEECIVLKEYSEKYAVQQPHKDK